MIFHNIQKNGLKILILIVKILLSVRYSIFLKSLYTPFYKLSQSSYAFKTLNFIYEIRKNMKNKLTVYFGEINDS